MSATLRAVESVRRRRQARAAVTVRDASDEGVGRGALVTGASAGIGRDFAELLAAKRYDLVLVARRKTRLEEIKADLERRYGVSVHIVPADLSETGTPEEIYAALQRRGIGVDVLVNNAASAIFGRFADHPLDDQRSILQLDGISVLEMCHLFLPHMVERRWGRIINVSSVAGLWSGVPESLAYGSSKAMVIRFSEGLATEYASLGVHVTASIPGATDTDWFDATGMQAQKSPWVTVTMMPATTVAREAYDACMRGERFIVHGVPTKVWGALSSHAPRKIRYGMVRWVANTKPDSPPTTTAHPPTREDIR